MKKPVDLSTREKFIEGRRLIEEAMEELGGECPSCCASLRSHFVRTNWLVNQAVAHLDSLAPTPAAPNPEPEAATEEVSSDG